LLKKEVLCGVVLIGAAPSYSSSAIHFCALLVRLTGRALFYPFPGERITPLLSPQPRSLQ